jgi:coenzyme Q-binding protein COQ10
METYHTRRRVPFTPLQMFEIVAKVEDYPKFLPLCEELRVRRREDNGHIQVLVADMTVAYSFVRETFASRVTLERTIPRVLVEYLDGPFRHLENRWLFHALDKGGCEVDFYIAYEFRSRMLHMMMGALFDRAVRKFAEAFEARAREVYGAADRAPRVRA